MKKYYLLAVTLAALVSCSSDDFVGNDSPTVENNTGEAIAFGGGFKAITRSNVLGADAADLLELTKYEITPGEMATLLIRCLGFRELKGEFCSSD